MGKILLCGYPRSGNTLMRQILSEYQKEKHQFSSFAEHSGISTLMRFYEQDKFLYNGRSEIDLFTIINGSFHFVYPNHECRNIKVDQKMFTSSSSLIRTHNVPHLFIDLPILSGIDHLIYVYRDPRAVYLSLCHYVVSPVYVKLLPASKIRTAEEIMERDDLTVKWTTNWRDHIRPNLK